MAHMDLERPRAQRRALRALVADGCVSVHEGLEGLGQQGPVLRVDESVMQPLARGFELLGKTVLVLGGVACDGRQLHEVKLCAYGHNLADVVGA